MHAKIKVKAVCGGKESDELEFIVGYPVESITASANGVTNIIKGTNIPLSKEILPTNADIDDFKWEIIEGAGACFVNGDNLYVNATATTGTIIKVKAVCGGKESEVLEFMVGYYVESVTASANGVTNIKRGESITLYKEILPEVMQTALYYGPVSSTGDGLLMATAEGIIGHTLDSYTTKYDGLVNSLRECYEIVRANRAELEIPDKSERGIEAEFGIDLIDE